MHYNTVASAAVQDCIVILIIESTGVTELQNYSIIVSYSYRYFIEKMKLIARGVQQALYSIEFNVQVSELKFLQLEYSQ